MSTWIFIKADTNDADYIETIFEADDEIVLLVKKIAKLFEEKKKNEKWGHNWENSEYGNTTPEEMWGDKLTEDEIENFNDILPYGEEGIHSVKQIKIFEVENVSTIFN